jgi:predicted nucleic acid-binding protein
MRGKYLLDTNALSTLYDKRHARRVPRFREVVLERIREDREIAVPVFAFYEARRGIDKLLLGGKGAEKLASFETLMLGARFFSLDMSGGWLKASRLWAQSRFSGSLIEDGDLMIAATAMAHERKLVTADQALIHALHRLGLGHVVDAHALE